MRIRLEGRPRGIALVIVMISILVLAVLAGGFAYSMKVETRLARNVNSATDVEWLACLGVEMARWVLAEQAKITSEPYDSLNQIWAGGSGGMGTSNSPLFGISLKDVPLGRGKFSLTIVDQERKFNINVADELILQQAMKVMGVDIGESSAVVDSILDWRDDNSNTRMNGEESTFYLSLPIPYQAKNGPLDDISELLLINGVTPALYAGGTESLPPSKFYSRSTLGPDGKGQISYAMGLKDLFGVIGEARINLNTATEAALQLIPGMDPNLAAAVVQARSGGMYAGGQMATGMEGDAAFASVQEVRNVPGMSPQLASLLERYCSVRSTTFEVQVDVEVDQYKRRFVALVRRNNPRDVQVMNVRWQ